ncbi:MAG: type II toxin-antitoxin system VapB family antitoxin [Acidobacteriales bacterium]|nr:type II toxin-antitoxin system VapB family antitoxin [Terriglobales bacterium]
MPTNLALDDRLIDEARRVGGHKTKKQAVTVALEEYVRRYRQAEILELAGKLDYFTDYNYKQLRRDRHRP